MHVIVTGGSSGIGLAVAKLYAARGAKISLLARDRTRLEQARAEIVKQYDADTSSILLESVDVGSVEDTVEAIARCERAFGICDLLITSAGIVEPDVFDSMPAAVFAEQVTTNLLGTANAVRAVYTGMKARGRGDVMMISSGAALIGIYGYTAYCASKAALAGFAEALKAEAAESGIRVFVCFPPDTLTSQYHREISMRPAQAELLMGTVKPWAAEAVAARIVHSIDRGKSTIYFGFSIAVLGYFGPLVKPFLFRWVARKLDRMKKDGTGTRRRRESIDQQR